MRIIGGRFKGRSLAAPRSRAIRPTSDRLRETIFNILAHAHDDPVVDARIVDLFAGTGALGFEALSRGASFALFVDEGAEARALLRDNTEALGVGGNSRIFRRDATRLGMAPPGPPFTVAFIDPPYGRNLAEAALMALETGGWLAPGALCVIEEAAAEPFLLPENFAELDLRVQGDTAIRFCRARRP